MKISFLYIVRNEERTIYQSIMSIINFAHEVIIVLDPRSNDRTKDILMELVKRFPKLIKVFLHPFISDGHQREYSLMMADQTSDWYWIIDGDEVAADNVVKIVEMLKSTKANIFNYEGVHFVGDFKHIDASRDKHIWYHRIVRNNGRLYFETGKQHGLIQGYNGPEETIEGIVIYHYGKVKSPFKFIEDTAVTRMHGYEIHDPKIHDKMVSDLLAGKYPVKEFEGKHPSVMGLEEWGL